MTERPASAPTSALGEASGLTRVAAYVDLLAAIVDIARAGGFPDDEAVAMLLPIADRLRAQLHAWMLAGSAPPTEPPAYAVPVAATATRALAAAPAPLTSRTRPLPYGIEPGGVAARDAQMADALEAAGDAQAQGALAAPEPEEEASS